MNKLKEILVKVLYPGGILSMLIVLCGFGVLIYFFITQQNNSLLEYAAYSLSTYALIVLVANSISVIRKIRQYLKNNPYTRRYLSEQEYRARIALYKGLFINSAYIILKAAMGIYYRSAWFGAVAVYYIVLSSIRFFLIHSDRKSLTTEQALRCYRSTGISMLLLNIAMAGMIIQMVWHDKGYSYPGFIIYASAAYTFYVVITAIINAIKFHKHNPILAATKMLNFIAALMSLFALQTAMLTQFDNDRGFRVIMNMYTGAAVALLTIGIAVFMVIRGNSALKKIRERSISNGTET